MCIAPEHGAELIRDAAKELLYARRVADKSRRGFQPPRRDVAHGRLYVAGDPFHEVGGVLVLHSPSSIQEDAPLSYLTSSIDLRYTVEIR